MKKALVVTVFIFIAMQAVNAQPLFSYDPYPAMSRIDEEAAVLAIALVREVVNPSKKCLLKGKKKLMEGVSQSYIVIDYNGFRFSIYYQDSQAFSEGWDSYLAIYIRPQGTEAKDSLIIFRDDYLNGSWDRSFINGREIDGEFVLDSLDYEKSQEDFEAYMQDALNYFKE